MKEPILSPSRALSPLSDFDLVLNLFDLFLSLQVFVSNELQTVLICVLFEFTSGHLLITILALDID